MPTPLLLLLIGGLVLYAAAGPLRRSFAVVVAATVLLPGTLLVPGLPTPAPNAVRLVHLAFLVGLVLRVRTGRLEAGVLRPSLAVLALAVYTAGSFVLGITVAPETALAATEPQIALGQWLKVPDQLLALVVFLAGARAIGDSRWLLRCLAGAATALVAVATWEHLSGGSYARWVFEGAPGQLGSVAAQPLEERGGALRVRAAATFALEYAWIVTMLLPLLLVVVTRARSLLAAFLPVLLFATIVWSVTRSALVAAAVGTVLLAGLRWRSPRMVGFVVTGAVAAGLVLLVAPAADDPFTGPDAQGSVQVRGERLPIVLGLVADRPVTGLGIGGVQAAGVPVLDSTFLVVYSETGAIGLALVCLAVAAGLADVVRGRLRLDAADRAASDAALVAVLLGVAGAASMSLLQQPTSSRVLWLVVGVGTAIAERGRRLDREAPATLPAAGAAALAGLVAGVLLAVVGPERAVLTANVFAISTSQAAVSPTEQVTVGNMQLNTACALLEHSAQAAGARTRCANLREAPGTGLVRFEASDTESLGQAVDRATQVAESGVAGLAVVPTGPLDEFRATWAATAPVWVPLVAGGAVLILWGERRCRPAPARPGPRRGIAGRGGRIPQVKRSPASGTVAPRSAPTPVPASRSSSLATPVRSRAQASSATRRSP